MAAQYVPPPPPSPTPVFLELNIRNLRPDAWWRTCLYVSVNGADDKAQRLGCSKGDGAIVANTAVRIEANPHACNTLRFFVNVHQNPVGTKCVKEKPCVTEESPTCQRVSARQADRPFFVFIDALELMTLPPKVKVKDVEILKGNKELYEKARANPTGSKIVRMFFEDQSNANLAKYGDALKSKDDKTRVMAPDVTGIDFNDFVIDVDTSNVAVTIDGWLENGRKIPCALPAPADYEPYVETTQPAGCSRSNLELGQTPPAKPAQAPK